MRNAIQPERVRLRSWRAFLRSALYLAERDLAFNTPCWRIIRGIAPPEGIASAFERNARCGQSTVRMQTTPFPFKAVRRFIPILTSRVSLMHFGKSPRKRVLLEISFLKGQGGVAHSLL